MTREGIRHRAREMMRDELADVALRLFDERGFEATTVDEIAEAAGISPRTFYRYFPAKEDVFPGNFVPAAEHLRARLEHHLLAHEPWPALHLTFREVATHLLTDPEHWARISRIIETSATLRARNLDKHLTWAHHLIPTLAEQAPEEAAAAQVRARVLAHTALICLDTAYARWVTHPHTIDLLATLDTAFRTLSPRTQRCPGSLLKPTREG